MSEHWFRKVKPSKTELGCAAAPAEEPTVLDLPHFNLFSSKECPLRITIQR
jgi:hypothetical protein